MPVPLVLPRAEPRTGDVLPDVLDQKVPPRPVLLVVEEEQLVEVGVFHPPWEVRPRETHLLPRRRSRPPRPAQVLPRPHRD